MQRKFKRRHNGKFMGEGKSFPCQQRKVREIMYTVSDIIADIDRGCMAHNMIEDSFSYRIVFFVNEGNKGYKHYTDTPYSGLRKALEGIIRGNLAVTNSIVIAETTALKNGKCVCLQSRTYTFSLEGYFRQINGEYKGSNRNGAVMHGRYAAR